MATFSAKPRYVRFSLRAILLAMLLAGIVFGWIQRSRQQRESIRQIRASNPTAALLYNFEVDASGALKQQGTPPGPDWLRERLGVDYLSSIVGVDMFYPTDADVAILGRFPRLRRLHLERSIDLTDKGLEHLVKLTSLKLLVLGEADQVTDAGLQQLAALKNLVELRLDRSRRMTSEGIERLRQRLPNCRIEIRDNPDNEVFASAAEDPWRSLAAHDVQLTTSARTSRRWPGRRCRL